MTDIIKEPDLSTSETKSLPANSSWWTFFVTDLFGRNYCNFKGRASRKEFWTFNCLSYVFVLLIVLIGIGLLSLSGDLTEDNIEQFVGEDSAFYVFIQLFLLLPTVSLAVRRCHDLNLSGWWVLLFIMFYFIGFFKGDRHDNKYGINIYEDEISPSELPIALTPEKRIFSALLGDSYFKLKGRTSRLEFIAVWAVYFGLPLLLLLTSVKSIVVLLFIIGFFPLWSVSVRRLHDLNLSGWWGVFVLPLVLCLLISGKHEDNKYGENIYIQYA